MKQYLIVNSNDPEHLAPYWYGYFEGTTCYWSKWQLTLSEAIMASMEYYSCNETLQQYCNSINPNLTITLLSGPITVESHPEYFI